MDEISYAGGPSRIRRKLSKRVILFGVLGLVVLVLAGGLIFFVTRDSSSGEEGIEESIVLPTPEEVLDTPSPTLEESPTPTKAPITKTPTKEPAETSDSDSLKISVQNGSGEAGVAASAAAVLKQAGYEIVSTGNADNFNYTNVVIKIKNSRKSLLADLQKALKEDYAISETTTDLSEGQTFDALVIVGKQ